MQPNQPDLGLQNTAAPSGANVPEYLHLDPIVDPAVEAKKAKRRLFFVMIVAILIITAATASYWFLVANSPKERLYRALEQSLVANYVTKQYTIVVKGAQGIETTTMKVNSDLSQPSNPKTSVEDYIYKRTNSYEPGRSIDGRVVIVGDQQATAVSQNSMKTNETLNTWSLKTLANTAELSYSLADVESMPVLNSSQGIIVMGNFTNDQRISLMNEIKTQAIYTIVDSSTINDNNRSQTEYTILIDSSKLNQLNKSVARLLSMGQVLTHNNQRWSNQEILKLTVDNKTDKITKLYYAAGTEGKSNSVAKTITFTYPPALNITLPSLGSSAQ